jgi:hypothetical protein
MAMIPLPAFSKKCIASQNYRGMTEELIEEMEG